MQKIIEDRYEFIEELGGGAFSKVLKARQLSTGKLVAVKLLLPERLEDNEHAHLEVARFEREMKLVAKLKHPNIIPIIDSGQLSEEQLFLVFEYVEGRSLEEVLAQEKCLSPAETKTLMLQVLDALSAAHEKGIVHRDLKPGNIMLAWQGFHRRAFVLDFGLSAITEEAREKDYVTLTLEGIVPGTPFYMAPEQLRLEPLSSRSDIYAWGLVFLECLTGDRPYDGKTFMQIVRAQLSEDPVPLPAWIDGHPVQAILQRALEKEPEARYQTAKELYGALSDCDVSDLRPPRQPVPSMPPFVPELRGARKGAPVDASEDAEDAEDDDGIADINALAVMPQESTPIKSGRGPEPQWLMVGGAILVGLLVALGISALSGSDDEAPTEEAEEAPPPSDEARCAKGENAICLKLGQQALKSGDALGALAYLDAACGAAVEGSCGAYREALEGAGELADHGAAFETFRAACEASDPHACLAQGVLLYEGRVGEEEDPEAGAALYQRACEGGAAEACYRMGIAELVGKGVSANTEAGVGHLEEACEGGYADACSRMASAYRRGRTVKADKERQYHFTRSACELGSGADCLSAAEMAARGRGTERSASQALVFREQACDAGVGQGCFESCQMLRATGNAEGAMTRCEQGCDVDSPESCAELAELLEAASGDVARIQALREKACEGGVEKACD